MAFCDCVFYCHPNNTKYENMETNASANTLMRATLGPVSRYICLCAQYQWDETEGMCSMMAIIDRLTQQIYIERASVARNQFAWSHLFSGNFADNRLRTGSRRAALMKSLSANWCNRLKHTAARVISMDGSMRRLLLLQSYNTIFGCDSVAHSSVRWILLRPYRHLQRLFFFVPLVEKTLQTYCTMRSVQQTWKSIHCGASSLGASTIYGKCLYEALCAIPTRHGRKGEQWREA